MVKVINKKNGTIKEVNENLLNDYLDTKEWQIYVEDKSRGSDYGD